MAEHELMSAKYLISEDDASSAGSPATIQKSRPAQSSRVKSAARASRWISIVAAVAVVGCVIAAVVPYLRAPSVRKATSPLDWLIRLCGVEPDKAVEKMLRERGEANKREWDEKFRQSPVFQIDPSKPIEWHFEPQTKFK